MPLQQHKFIYISDLLVRVCDLQCKVYRAAMQNILILTICNLYYFDTLQFEANTLRPRSTPWDALMVHTHCFRLNIQKPSRRKKSLFRKNVYMVNLDPAVITLPFGGQHDACDPVRYKDFTDLLVATLLAVDLDEFYRQHSFGFHAFKIILL